MGVASTEVCGLWEEDPPSSPLRAPLSLAQLKTTNLRPEVGGECERLQGEISLAPGAGQHEIELV